MHDHIALKKTKTKTKNKNKKQQHPTQNFHKNLKKFQKPQIFQRKPKNLGIMREMHEKRGI